LCFEGNVALNWKHFAQEVEIFIAAAHREKDKTKVYIFLNLAGREAIEKERKFAEICYPCGNVIMERHKISTPESRKVNHFSHL